MNFQLKVLLLSFVVSVILGAIIIPILRKLKVGQIERTDGPQSHLKKRTSFFSLLLSTLAPKIS